MPARRPLNKNTAAPDKCPGRFASGMGVHFCFCVKNAEGPSAHRRRHFPLWKGPLLCLRLCFRAGRRKSRRDLRETGGKEGSFFPPAAFRTRLPGRRLHRLPAFLRRLGRRLLQGKNLLCIGIVQILQRIILVLQDFGAAVGKGLLQLHLVCHFLLLGRRKLAVVALQRRRSIAVQGVKQRCKAFVAPAVNRVSVVPVGIVHARQRTFRHAPRQPLRRQRLGKVTLAAPAAAVNLFAQPKPAAFFNNGKPAAPAPAVNLFARAESTAFLNNGKPAAPAAANLFALAEPAVFLNNGKPAAPAAAVNLFARAESTAFLNNGKPAAPTAAANRFALAEPTASLNNGKPAAPAAVNLFAQAEPATFFNNGKPAAPAACANRFALAEPTASLNNEKPAAPAAAANLFAQAEPATFFNNGKLAAPAAAANLFALAKPAAPPGRH